MTRQPLPSHRQSDDPRADDHEIVLLHNSPYLQRCLPASRSYEASR